MHCVGSADHYLDTMHGTHIHLACACPPSELAHACDPQMSHYEEDEEGLTLHFDRGQPTVHARVLIGADGYFSKTRSQCVNDGPPTFSVCVLINYGL